jgi:hypothetical protein
MNNNKFEPKPPVRNTHITRRDFEYSLGQVSLNFTLRIDIKEELTTFRKLLIMALEDVEKEIGPT